jgi:hypothetical protein
MAQAQDTPTHYKVALALGRHADGNNTHDHSLRWLAKESVKSGQDAVSVRTLVNHLLCFEETGAICVGPAQAASAMTGMSTSSI